MIQLLDYGELGVVPDVDGALGVAWDFVQQHIDFDSAHRTVAKDN